MIGSQAYSSFFAPILYAVSTVQEVYTHIFLISYSTNTKGKL